METDGGCYGNWRAVARATDLAVTLVDREEKIDSVEWIVGPAEKRGDLGRETHLVDSIGKDLPVSHSQSTARPGKQA